METNDDARFAALQALARRIRKVVADAGPELIGGPMVMIFAPKASGGLFWAREDFGLPALSWPETAVVMQAQVRKRLAEFAAEAIPPEPEIAENPRKSRRRRKP